MAQPNIKTEIEARVKDTGDTMTGNLYFKEYSRINEAHPTDLNYTALCLDAINGDYFTRIANFCYDDGTWGPILQKWKIDGTYIDGTQLIYNKYPGVFKSNVNGNNFLLGTDTVNKILFRNDGTNFWILITDVGSDGYNDLRPFRLELSTGNVWINGGTPLTSSNYNNYTPTLTGTGASGTWGISISGNSATSTLATTADKASTLKINSTANLSSCLQYIQQSTQTEGNDLPSATWHHVLKMNHGTGDTYYKRLLAFDFWDARGIKTAVATGDGITGTWYKLWCEGDSITSAVWNDYAEYREADIIEPGYVLIEKGDDTLEKSSKRLSHFYGVSSDTWGFSQGETEKAKTPVAVAGRVLVYPFQKRENYQPGQCVCAAPGGTVDIMSDEEVMKHPDKIVGIVSCVPNYDTWGGGPNADRPEVQVNGRIWIKVK